MAPSNGGKWVRYRIDLKSRLWNAHVKAFRHTATNEILVFLAIGPNQIPESELDDVIDAILRWAASRNIKDFKEVGRENGHIKFRGYR